MVSKSKKFDRIAVMEILKQVEDPEVPVLTIEDLGVLRDVEYVNEVITVIITPTYSGCPAMDMITVNVKAAMQEAGYNNVAVKLVLSPAWTTDWMSESGKQKLKEYGIAPPVGPASDKAILFGEEKKIACPLCDSFNTELISQFGSTACKALHRCLDCKEPFDYFKCH